MLMRLCDRFDERRASLGGGSEQGLGAFVQVAFDYMRDQRRVSAAILAAVANDPKLLGPIRERRSEEVKRLGGGVRGIARGLVVMLAVDGLWYSEMLEMMNLTDEMRRAVLAELMELVQRAEEEVEQ
jgi:pyruvoyl-dependent arginine decarboxylase (PvlArgDC)